jgi:hypothetical protein
MGTRLRLKAGKDISGYSAPVRKIFQAMKTYGLIVADNGSDMYVQGTYDTRWDNGLLNPAFGSLKAGDFEVVELGWRPSSPPSAVPGFLSSHLPRSTPGRPRRLQRAVIAPSSSGSYHRGLCGVPATAVRFHANHRRGVGRGYLALHPGCRGSGLLGDQLFDGQTRPATPSYRSRRTGRNSAVANARSADPAHPGPERVVPLTEVGKLTSLFLIRGILSRSKGAIYDSGVSGLCRSRRWLSAALGSQALAQAKALSSTRSPAGCSTRATGAALNQAAFRQEVPDGTSVQAVRRSGRRQGRTINVITGPTTAGISAWPWRAQPVVSTIHFNQGERLCQRRYRASQPDAQPLHFYGVGSGELLRSVFSTSRAAFAP